jgi:hypothetical protein
MKKIIIDAVTGRTIYRLEGKKLEMVRGPRADGVCDVLGDFLRDDEEGVLEEEMDDREIANVVLEAWFAATGAGATCRVESEKPIEEAKAHRNRPEPAPVDDRKPSQVTDAYWLFARRKIGDYPTHSEKGGKWLVFVPVGQIDEVWAKIKDAPEKGLLGDSAKTGTAMPNPNATNQNTKVICVYTYDWTDEGDVRRVREQLRELGITAKIPYKADSDTSAGKYYNRGHRRISKYYE